jgi:hypothetical protein
VTTITGASGPLMLARLWRVDHFGAASFVRWKDPLLEAIILIDSTFYM